MISCAVKISSCALGGNLILTGTVTGTFTTSYFSSSFWEQRWTWAITQALPTANIDSFLFLFSHFPIIPLLLTNIYLEIGLSLMTFSVGRVPEYSLPSEKKNCNCQFLRSATCLHTVLVFKMVTRAGNVIFLSACLVWSRNLCSDPAFSKFLYTPLNLCIWKSTVLSLTKVSFEHPISGTWHQHSLLLFLPIAEHRRALPMSSQDVQVWVQLAIYWLLKNFVKTESIME